MPSVTLRDNRGRELSPVELDERVFGAAVRQDLVHAAVVAQLAAKRTGTHQAKSRGQVSGGGKKPYRQKGTGRARQGSTRAPQWRGGGVAFPPLPRDYSQKLPRKVKRQALFAAWSDHAANGTLVVVDDLGLTEPKTKLAVEALRSLLAPQADRVAGVTEAPDERPEGDSRPVRRRKVRQRALLLVSAGDGEAKRALRNIQTVEFDYEHKVTVVFAVQVGTAPYASVYDLTLADAVVLTRGALERITAEFAPAEEAAS